jgi:hypothetical protein
MLPMQGFQDTYNATVVSYTRKMYEPQRLTHCKRCIYVGLPPKMPKAANVAPPQTYTIHFAGIFGCIMMTLCKHFIGIFVGIFVGIFAGIFAGIFVGILYAFLQAFLLAFL